VTEPSPVLFTLFALPDGGQVWIPADIPLTLPDPAAVPLEILHRLAYIPWEPRYLDRVDPEYRDFFSFVHPYLRPRTTDVQVATCLPFVPLLIEEHPEPVDGRVVRIALILHDSGWSQMSDSDIAASLGVSGLALSSGAREPKMRHAELGRGLAAGILDEYRFEPPLSPEQKEETLTAILYHDRPEELAASGGTAASARLVCDVDHLWSFTHENFWQDTVRKRVAPPRYLENLAADLQRYFVTAVGRRRAAAMLEDRRIEVDAWREWVGKGGERDS
jgi:hypothetical protein